MIVSKFGNLSTGILGNKLFVVTITFASLFSSLSPTAFSINASNNGPTIAPIFKIPNNAK